MNQTQSKHKHKRQHDHVSKNPQSGQKKPNNFKKNRNFYKRTFADQHLHDDYRKVLKRYRDFTNKIRSYIIHCSEEQLLWSTNANAWNIKEILGFITLKDAYIFDVVNEVVTGEGLEFQRQNTEEKMENEEFNSRSLEHLMRIYNDQRKKILSSLYSSKDDAWQNVFSVDSESQNLVEFLTLHLDNDDKLIDMIFLNLQRHQPWYIEEEVLDLEDIDAEAETETETETETENISESTEPTDDPEDETEVKASND